MPVCDHLSVEELEARYLGFQNVTALRHFQVIWLVVRGHTISQVPETAAYGERWIGQLLARYNTEGPEAPGGLRRRNGAPAIILNPGLLAVIGFAIRRLMAGCGRATRWRLGWLAKHIATIPELEEKIANQCIALTEQPEQIHSRAGFHWWPKRIAPN